MISKAPSTLIRFQMKTELRRKRSPKTDPFENALQRGAIWKRCFFKRCFLVWTEKTMLSENGDFIKIDSTGRLTTRPWVSKMADSRYHVVFLLIGVVVWTGENDKCGRKSFWKRSKTAQCGRGLKVNVSSSSALCCLQPVKKHWKARLPFFSFIV